MKDNQETKRPARQAEGGEDKSIAHTGNPSGENNYPRKGVWDKQYDNQAEFADEKATEDHPEVKKNTSK